MKTARCAVIFDWNGTLIADTMCCLRATNATLAAFRQPPVTLKTYRTHYDIPLRDMYKHFGCSEHDLDNRQAELAYHFIRFYEADAENARARKGATRTLAHLGGEGYQTAILSNYLTHKIRKQTDRLGLTRHFSAILGNDVSLNGLFKRQEKGEKLAAFLEEKEIKKAVIVGDTTEEIAIARAYGHAAIALTDGVCSSERLRAARPDFLIRSLEEVPEIAHRVFSRSDA